MINKALLYIYILSSFFEMFYMKTISTFLFKVNKVCSTKLNKIKATPDPGLIKITLVFIVSIKFSQQIPLYTGVLRLWC